MIWLHEGWRKKNTEFNTLSLGRSLSNPKPTLKLSSKSFKKIFLNTIVTFNSLQKIIFLSKIPKFLIFSIFQTFKPTNLQTFKYSLISKFHLFKNSKISQSSSFCIFRLFKTLEYSQNSKKIFFQIFQKLLIHSLPNAQSSIIPLQSRISYHTSLFFFSVILTSSLSLNTKIIWQLQFSLRWFSLIFQPFLPTRSARPNQWVHFG